MNTSWKTAIKRKSLSRPMKFLADNKLLVGKILDYGCGQGEDAKILKTESYDPHWNPTVPEEKFDTITCLFVLNVVSEVVQATILKKIKRLLTPNGKAYIAVRRDIKKDYSVRDYKQRLVYLSLESIEKNRDYEIYKLENKK